MIDVSNIEQYPMYDGSSVMLCRPDIKFFINLIKNKDSFSVIRLQSEWFNIIEESLRLMYIDKHSIPNNPNLKIHKILSVIPDGFRWSEPFFEKLGKYMVFAMENKTMSNGKSVGRGRTWRFRPEILGDQVKLMAAPRPDGLFFSTHCRAHWLGEGFVPPARKKGTRHYNSGEIINKLCLKKDLKWDSTLWRRWFWNGEIQRLFNYVNNNNVKVVVIGAEHLYNFGEVAGINNFSFIETDSLYATNFIDKYYKDIVKNHEKYLDNSEYVLYLGSAGATTQWIFSKLHGKLRNAAMIDIGRAIDVYYFYESLLKFGERYHLERLQGSWLLDHRPEWLKPKDFPDDNFINTEIARKDYVNRSAELEYRRNAQSGGFGYEPVAFCKPYIPNMSKYKSYIDAICATGHLTNNGPLVNELQDKLSEYLGVRNLLLVSSGTTALEVAYKVLGLSGEVITTPFSFAATPNSMLWVGLKPKFADIDLNTLNINPFEINKLISADTSGIVAVHTFGNACEVDKIQEIANKNSLKVIYDAAHCFGTRYDSKSILSFGDISTFSLHATKIFHTIEGGGLVIKDDALYAKAKSIINFGILNGVPEFVGTNAKMNEFNAAMGLCCLEDVGRIFLHRNMVYDAYKKNLSSKIIFQEFDEKCSRNNGYFPIIFKTEAALLETKSLLDRSQIGSRRYFYPSLDTLPYINSNIISKNSLDISKRILCLPIYYGLKYKDVYKICKLINLSLK